MKIEQRKKLSTFALASVFLHLILAIAVNSLLDTDKLIITSVEVKSFEPLMVSMLRSSDDKAREKKKILEATATLEKKPSMQFKREAPLTENQNSGHTQVTVSDNNLSSDFSNTDLSVSTDNQIIDSQIILTETQTKSNLEQTHNDRKLADIKNTEIKGALIRKKLSAFVERNFRYPRFAVKRGWEGTVELGLRVEANGRLSNVRIVKTSGYSILDEAALTTLTETDYINGLEAWLAGNYFDTTLPVKYQLVGG